MPEYEEKVKVNENDINRFIRYVKKLMKHKEKWLVDTSETVNLQKQQTFFSLVFRGFPIYEEIINGTPKLSLIFELSQATKSSKSVMVARRGIKPLLPG